MKLTYTPKWKAQSTAAIPQHVAAIIRSRAYDSGQVERAQQTADACAEMLGNLIDKLAERGLLNAADIIDVLDVGINETEPLILEP